MLIVAHFVVSFMSLCFVCALYATSCCDVIVLLRFFFVILCLWMVCVVLMFCALVVGFFWGG